MRNIRIDLQYDGTHFSGYELQPGKRTVRGEIEKALHKLFKARIPIISASRTDAGVHALCQTINFPLKHPIPANRIAAALNSTLPEDIRATKAQECPRKFHARFAPKNKEYEYLIYNGEIMPPHLRNLAWHVKPKLDLAAMKKAAKYFVGKHDFSSFCAAGGDDRDFVRIIHSFVIRNSSFVIWPNQKTKVLAIKVKGSGFLYKMVRNLVGTLVDVGTGRVRLTIVNHILKAKDRKAAGRTAPAHGLCLVKIDY